MEKISLNRTELSEFYSVSMSTIDIWERQGMKAEGGGGRGKVKLFNLQESVNWRLDRAKAENSDVSEKLERERLRKLRRENDEAEKLVAPVSLIEEVLGKSTSIIIAILESLPLHLKRNFPEITGDQITLVKKSIAEMRNAIADSRLPEEWLRAAEKRAMDELEARREAGK